MTGASVSMRRRVAKHRNEEHRANEVISALNALAPPTFQRGPLTAAQRAARQQVLVQVRDAPLIDVESRAAVNELLASGQPSYDGGLTGCTVRPYDRGLVSLPAVGADVRPLGSLLDDYGRQVLNNFSRDMLLSHDERGQVLEKQDVIKPYMDVNLRRSPEVYRGFVLDLWQRNMISFSSDPLEIITPFFVAKKDGRLR